MTNLTVDQSRTLARIIRNAAEDSGGVLIRAGVPAEARQLISRSMVECGNKIDHAANQGNGTSETMLRMFHSISFQDAMDEVLKDNPDMVESLSGHQPDKPTAEKIHSDFRAMIDQTIEPYVYASIALRAYHDLAQSRPKSDKRGTNEFRR